MIKGAATAFSTVAMAAIYVATVILARQQRAMAKRNNDKKRVKEIKIEHRLALMGVILTLLLLCVAVTMFLRFLYLKKTIVSVISTLSFRR